MKRTSVSLFIVSLTVLAAGCGSKGTITGTVTYQGKPIPSGNIVFAPESGAPVVTAPIMDGKYTADKVSAGNAKVTITSMYMDREPSVTTNPMMSGKMGPPPEAPPEARKAFEKNTQFKKGLKIPEKYADPGRSGLTYTVQTGNQTKDFKLD